VILARIRDGRAGSTADGSESTEDQVIKEAILGGTERLLEDRLMPTNANNYASWKFIQFGLRRILADRQCTDRPSGAIAIAYVEYRAHNGRSPRAQRLVREERFRGPALFSKR
jgi:hypothetical protein